MRFSHAIAIVVCLTGANLLAEERAHMAALASIRADQAMAHVEVLASDAMEGRRGGSRGGRAAAAYLVNQLKQMGWQPAGAEGDFYQPFPGGRNILAVLPGTDEAVKHEHIVVGAHYDHVGYGDRRTSFGPIGHIHNGADDNASGVACLLEFAEAIAQHKIAPRRSLLLAFWDSEELGLLGSQHWCRRPTVPMQDVPLSINVDMVGRLRKGRIEVGGTRTGAGLRRLASVAMDSGIWLDFTWKLEGNSDHWNFIQHRVPTLMLHTGLHDDYHRPSDDVGAINSSGVRLVSRYLFDLALTAADADKLPKYRPQGMREGPALQQHRERALPPYSPDAPRPRIGFSWRADNAEPGVVYLTRVVPNSPAAQADLQLHDRVHRLNGELVSGTADFERRIGQLLKEDAAEFTLHVERDGRVEEYTVVCTSLGPRGTSIAGRQ